MTDSLKPLFKLMTSAIITQEKSAFSAFRRIFYVVK